MIGTGQKIEASAFVAKVARLPESLTGKVRKQYIDKACGRGIETHS